MSDLLARLRAAVDPPEVDDLEPFIHGLQRALLRVIERHRFVECGNARCAYGGWCLGCDPQAVDVCGDHPWPCPELLNIADDLGVPYE